MYHYNAHAHYKSFCSTEAASINLRMQVNHGFSNSILISKGIFPADTDCSLNTYETCRAPWPPGQPAPARWDRSCSICPWVYLRRRRSLRPAEEAAEVQPAARRAVPAAPC